MANASARGSRLAGLTLVVTGGLMLVASFATWRVCPTTPCGGPFQALSFSTGIDLGFGVVTACAAVVVSGIGLRASTHGIVRRWAAAAGLAAAAAAIVAAASLVWMRFLAPGGGAGWLSPGAVSVAILGLVAAAAAVRLRARDPFRW